jgi:hypothetical protein
MKRWLAATGGAAITTLIVVACAEHAPQTPSQVARSQGADENGRVTAQQTPLPPVFPSPGPTPQSFPSAGPTPQSFPSAGPTPQSFPSPGPTPQSFPSAGPTPQTFPSTNAPQPTPNPTPTPVPTPTPSSSPTPGPSPSTNPTPNPNSFAVRFVSVASNRSYVAFQNPQAFITPQYIDDLAWRSRTQYTQNSWIVRTALADATRNQDPFLTISTNQPARVDVLIDDSAEPTPAWVEARGYRNLFGTNDITTGSAATRSMRVWTAFRSAGTIQFGPPLGSSPQTVMYVVYVIPCSASPTVCPVATFAPRGEDTDSPLP